MIKKLIEKYNTNMFRQKILLLKLHKQIDELAKYIMTFQREISTHDKLKEYSEREDETDEPEEDTFDDEEDRDYWEAIRPDRPR